MAKKTETTATPEQLADIDRQAEATAQRSIDKLGEAHRAAEGAKSKAPKGAKSKASEG